MSARRVAPHGTWRSPIDSRLVSGQSIRLGLPQIDGGHLYWLESRPTEGGRTSLLRRALGAGAVAELTPPPWNVRSRVHEYGGGAYAVRAGTVCFSHAADNRLYRLVPGSEPLPLTAEGPWRYADLTLDPKCREVLAVVENHSGSRVEPANSIGAIDLDGFERAPRQLLGGSDFYSNPRLSPDGKRLCWLQWAHPNMPWDGTELWVGERRKAGAIGDRTLVAGGSCESVFQPQWSPDGALHFVSDRTGFWNLYRWDGRPRPLLERRTEFGLPQWVFGMSTYGFLGDGRILAAYCEGGRWQLGIVTTDGVLEQVETPYSQIEGLSVDGSQAVFRGASPGSAPALMRLDVANGKLEVVRRSVPLQAGLGTFYSMAVPVAFPSDQGREVHGFLYRPRNPDFRAPAGERPPLIIRFHGGPTAAATDALSLTVQFWTTRGFAVLDLNYSGSTGYGRAYRELLRGQWGVAEVEDGVSAARHCISEGYARPDAILVKGASAGGFSVLCCLAFRDTFAGGTSYYGLCDLTQLTQGTHKFESRYHETLVGEWPTEASVYRERSPLRAADQITAPVLLFHGAADTVVPVSQTEQMVDALRASGAHVEYERFEKEAHGFRDEATIRRTLELELAFYLRALGIGEGDR
ncbi:MAG: prolyl oligopeptidase family serine peptidase [Bryobacterales bacterium]|nr:prolyl oligopeptidase family serine peptidase [Bryobacterales bacterium]